MEGRIPDEIPVYNSCYLPDKYRIAQQNLEGFNQMATGKGLIRKETAILDAPTISVSSSTHQAGGMDAGTSRPSKM